MKELNKLTIKEAALGLRKKEFSSLALTEAVFSRIEERNKDINAFISVYEKEALEKAKEADEKIKKATKEELAELSLLFGIPIAIKDNICVKDTRTTAGSRILENFIAPYDATVIKKLKEAGVIIIGKTNLDEFAMGSSTETSYFGTTKNPRDPSRVPGGSSGGSAAAVADNMALSALGSDTGGSIRQPASFCGIVGLKPTYGKVSRYGLLAMGSSLDQIGPITKNVLDAAIVLDAIAGFDKKDATSLSGKFTEYETVVKKGVKDFVIGLPKEYFIEGAEKEVNGAVKKSVRILEKLGARVKEISLPHTEAALSVYYILMFAEVSTNLGRYDGIKYGYSAEKDKNIAPKNLLEVYMKTRGSAFGKEVKRRIMLGTYVLSKGYFDAYYLKASRVRTLVKEDFEKAFQEVDILITPTSPEVAFKIGEKTNDPLKMYLSDVFTVPINIGGVPALSMPCGFYGKLPIGLQIIGPQLGEEKIFRTAFSLEQELKLVNR